MKPKFEDLTVFIISTGEETTDDCVTALREQDCVFTIETIQDVYPMSAAFQAMPDRCETPYFIQVDADMILKPHAVRTLYNGAKRTGFFTMAAFGQLYEEGFGVGGSIRCWKKGFFRFFSFRDRRTVDRDLYGRAKWFGFGRKDLKEVLGIHRPRHSVFSEYLKTRSDVEKWRFLGREAGLYAKPLYDEVVEEGEEGAHRLLGLLSGALTGKERYDRSKDYAVEKRRYITLMTELGYGPEGEGLIVRTPPSHLRDLFSDCYSHLSDVSNGQREALLNNITELFRKSADIAVNQDDLLQQLTE
jgi:hypothetical protein